MASYCIWNARPGASVGTVAGAYPTPPTSAEWDTAFVSLSEANTALGAGKAVGDVFFVADTHVETYAVGPGNILPTVQGISTPAGAIVLSIDKSNTTTATLKKGATVTSNDSIAYNINGNVYIYGINFQAGTGGAAGSSDITIGNNSATTSDGSTQFFENCSFYINSTSGAAQLVLAVADHSANRYFEFRNCQVRFPNSAPSINLAGAMDAYFINCGYDPVSTAVTTMFEVGANRTNQRFTFIGCDWSGGTNLISGTGADSWWGQVVKCVPPTNIITGTIPDVGAGMMYAHACASGDSTIDYYRVDGFGTVQLSTSIYQTTGSSQTPQASGTLTDYSLEINPTTVVSRYLPIYSPWVSKFISSTGSKTFSMNVAYDDATVSQNTEVWIEVEYCNAMDSAIRTKEISAPTADGGIFRDALVAGSNLTDTSEAWTGTGGWANKKTHTLSKTVTVNEQCFVRCRIGLARDVTTYVNNTVTVA